MRDPRNIILLLYTDDFNPAVMKWRKTLVIRVIPANYPSYIRADIRRWWPIAMVPRFVSVFFLHSYLKFNTTVYSC